MSISLVVKRPARQSSLVLNHNVRARHSLWGLGETQTLCWSHFSLYKLGIFQVNQQKKLHFLVHVNTTSLCKELTAVYKPPHVFLHAHVFTALKLLSRDMSKHPWGLAALPSSCQLCDFPCCSIWNHHKYFFVFILSAPLRWGQLTDLHMENWVLDLKRHLDLELDLDLDSLLVYKIIFSRGSALCFSCS